jgi:hypothetical protein
MPARLQALKGKKSNMSDESLTPNEFLKLKKGDIEGIFEESLPQSKGKPYFEPGLYNKLYDPTFQEMKRWKVEYTAKAAERKSILNWILPLVVLGPGLLTIIMAGGWAKSTSIVLTISAVAVVTYLWFFGRIWAYESKNFERNVEDAERAVDNTQDRRARDWAESRYDIRTEQIEWSEFSNFYIEGIGYRWKELPEDGKYIIAEVETEKEPPLLKSATATPQTLLADETNSLKKANTESLK